MQLVNEWYFWEKQFDEETCQTLMDLSSSDWGVSQVDTNKESTDEERIEGKRPNFEEKKELRTSDVKWADNDKLELASDILIPYIAEANDRAGWKFIIEEMQRPQLTRYKKGEYYSWHRDGGSDHLQGTKLVRKLSMTVCLNEDYEGGELQFHSYGKKDNKITSAPQGKGTIIVFPSFIEHQVTPVTKRVRYSLVAWITGPPFI